MTEAKIPSQQSAAHVEDTYSGKRFLEKYIANSQFDQPIVSAGSLSAIELLDRMERNKDQMTPKWKGIFEADTKYIDAAVKKLNDFPYLKTKFGEGSEAVFRLAAVMKSVQDEAVTNKILQEGLPPSIIDSAQMGVRRAIR